MVLVFYSVTPLQATIFATRTVSLSFSEPMEVSAHYLSLAQQDTQVTANFSYSVFGITWLNETLPAFMTRDFALAPFKLPVEVPEQTSEVWTAQTSMYSVDLNCEPSTVELTNGSCHSSKGCYYTPSNGCKVPWPCGPTGNDTVGSPGPINRTPIKGYSSIFVAYSDHDGLANYYLKPYCPTNASHVIFASWAQNKVKDQGDPRQPTAVFCEPSYYVQNVTANVFRDGKRVKDIIPHGPKAPIPHEIFNVTKFEWEILDAQQLANVRSDIPTPTWPDLTEVLANAPLTLDYQLYQMAMQGFALGAYPRPYEDYLDPMVLGQSYQAAYRILFSRAMTDVLGENYTNSNTLLGGRSYTTESVYLVPEFTYAVEGLLVIVLVFALVLIFICHKRPMRLIFDPAPISSLMSLSADEPVFLSAFQDLDTRSEEEIAAALNKRWYQMKYGQWQYCLSHAQTEDSTSLQSHVPLPPRAISTGCRSIRPLEFRLFAAAIFVTLQLGLAILFAVLYTCGIKSGLALPSSSRFLRQLVENYAPTLVATMIEPAWVVLNRLLCMLQPFEGLRNGRALSGTTITINYSSLPPQLVVWKALRAKHFVLAAVCSMALLANLLAIAFSGLFYEATVSVPSLANYSQPYLPRFTSINGSAGPDSSTLGAGGNVNTFYSGAYQGGQGLDQFYLAMANFTSGTPLPEWTDQNAFYLPFVPVSTGNPSDQHRMTARAFGAKLNCNSITDGVTLQAPYDMSNTLSVIITVEGGPHGPVNCSTGTFSDLLKSSKLACPRVPSASEILTMLIPTEGLSLEDSAFCTEQVFAAYVRSKGSLGCSWDKLLGPEQATMFACKPRLVTGLANVTVDSGGQLVVRASTNTMEDNAEDYLGQNLTAELMKQANSYLIRGTQMFTMSNIDSMSTGVWHNDSYPSDWTDYFIEHINGSNNFLDPAFPPPSYESIMPLFGSAYTQTFAIWLGRNYKKLLIPSNASTAPVVGTIFRQETRVFLSKPMFIISETILGLYVLTSIVLYFRRPARFLPRLPTTIASVIAYFAANNALEDLRSTAWMTTEQRRNHMRDLGYTYGFGGYIGTDGKAHTGIERRPFVTPSRRTILKGGTAKNLAAGLQEARDRGWGWPFAS